MKAKVLSATSGKSAAATARVRRETRAEARARAEAAFGMWRKYCPNGEPDFDAIDRALEEGKRERIAAVRRMVDRWKRDPKTGSWQKEPW